MKESVLVTTCKRCGIKKTWNGGDILCPFQNGEEFGDNWCCGQINKIRIIIEAAIEKKDSRFNNQYIDGQQYAMINVGDIDFENYADILYVSWYKNRGRTEGMWLMYEGNTRRKPLYEELQKIIDYYSKYL